MLSAPDAGWTEFRLGSEETAYSLSYLTDVAVEWLDQAKTKTGSVKRSIPFMSA